MVMERGCEQPAPKRPEEIEKPRQYYLPWLRILCVVQGAGSEKNGGHETLPKKNGRKRSVLFRKSKTGGKRRLALLTAWNSVM